MKYRLTPLNIFSAFLAGLVILFLAFPESIKNEPYDYQLVFLIPVIIVGVLIDYILQKTIKRYLWIFLVEIILIGTTLLINSF